MRHFTLGVVIVASLTLASCAKELQTGSVNTEKESSGINDSDVLKGWVRIKLEREAQPLTTGVVTRGESIMSGNDELNRIASELGAVEVRRVFNEGGKFAERRRKAGLHLWYEVRYEEDLPVSRAMTRFENIEGISYVEPVYLAVLTDNNVGVPASVVYTPASADIVRPSEMPFNDPGLEMQWDFNNNGSMLNSRTGADMNLFEAWKKTTGSPEVIVAVMDIGVEYTHKDLAANMWVNEAELNGQPGVDDDNNGYVDDIYGWNGMTNTGGIVPGDHGTHVAGTIAAVNNNGIGVCGIAGGDGSPNSGVKIMSLQAMGAGSSTDSTYSDNFIYAADNGAVISQNSWGFTTGILPQVVSEAMDYFIANAGVDKKGIQTGPMKGGILIFAAGNSSNKVMVPASDPRVIAVTAMSPDYTASTYTCFGAEADILAPGGADPKIKPYQVTNQIYSLGLDNTYVYMHGTSMACPHVSGVAALIVSYYGVGKPGFTAQQLKDRLLRAVRPIDPLYVTSKYLNKLGVGMLDAGMIFLENSHAKPSAPSQPKALGTNNEVTLSMVVPADGNDLPVANFKVLYKSTGVGKFEGVHPDGSGTVTYGNVVPIGMSASFLFEGSYNTKYDFDIVSVDRFGNEAATATKVSYTTGDYANQKPKLSEMRFESVTFDGTGEDKKMTLALAGYFTDPNLPEGDVLTYDVINRDEKIIKTSIENNSQLVLVPLAGGNGTISVTATDLNGEQVISTFKVEVVGTVPPMDSDGLTVYPSPVETTLTLSIVAWSNNTTTALVYDSASRKVMEEKVIFDASGRGMLGVDKLAPGVYTIMLKKEGENLKVNFVKK